MWKYVRIFAAVTAAIWLWSLCGSLATYSRFAYPANGNPAVDGNGLLYVPPYVDLRPVPAVLPPGYERSWWNPLSKIQGSLAPPSDHVLYWLCHPALWVFIPVAYATGHLPGIAGIVGGMVLAGLLTAAVLALDCFRGTARLSRYEPQPRWRP